MQQIPLTTFSVSPALPGPALSPYRHRLKRLLDVTVLLLTGPLVLPFVLLLALPAWLSGGQPFYGHMRIGRDGRRFTCWKLRTMARDADAVLEAHLAAEPTAAEEWRRYRKLARDPRITRFGRLLRRASLDELPQLLNVLRGEMSLVGPRPLTEAELSEYGAARHAYLLVTPGITGLWQVSGRNDLTMTQRAAFDMQYVQELSAWRDLLIICRTAKVVLEARG